MADWKRLRTLAGKDSPPEIVIGTDAASRFTKTPIKISDPGNIDDLIGALGKLGIKAYVEDPEAKKEAEKVNPVQGEYYPSAKESELTVNSPTPSLEDIHRILFHEDIHAALEKAGYKYPDLRNDWRDLIYDPVGQATEAFMRANRAGAIPQELPAYVGAYSPKEMPGLSGADRQRYLERLYSTLPPDTLRQLARIISNYSANPNSYFGRLVGAK